MTNVGDEVTPRLNPRPLTAVKGRPVNTSTALGRWMADNAVTVSEMAHVLGVSDRTVTNYLAGRRNPSADVVVEITAHTGLSVDQVMGRDARLGRSCSGDAEGSVGMLDRSMVTKAALVAMIGRRKAGGEDLAG